MVHPNGGFLEARVLGEADREVNCDVSYDAERADALRCSGPLDLSRWSRRGLTGSRGSRRALRRGEQGQLCVRGPAGQAGDGTFASWRV